MKVHNSAILKLLEREGVITSSEVAETFNISWNTAEKYMLELVIDNKVRRIKKKGVTLWLRA
jgi:Mn-dependent DtxR family transcriptional regulator